MALTSLCLQKLPLNSFFNVFIPLFSADVASYIEDVASKIDDVALYIEDVAPYIDDVALYIEDVAPYIDDVALYVDDVAS